jgi:hypothetical protein
MDFCSTCGTPLSEDARFCAKCGTPRQVSDTAQRQEFTIPLPDGSPLKGPFPDGPAFLNRQLLALLGITRPQPEDFLVHKGMTYIWRYHRSHAEERVRELETEGWELDEPFEPKQDFYGVLTAFGIRERFATEMVSVPGFIGPKPATAITGFIFRMKRVEGKR